MGSDIKVWFFARVYGCEKGLVWSISKGLHEVCVTHTHIS